MKQKLTIDQRNEAFDALSTSDKKMALAQDVIDFIRSKQLLAKIGTGYVDTSIFNWGDNDKELHEFIEDPDFNCTVCALGGLFMAHVYNTDNCKVGEFGNDGMDMIDRLDGIYTEAELRLIEAAFEGKVVASYEDLENRIRYPWRSNYDIEEAYDEALRAYDEAADAYETRASKAVNLFDHLDDADERLVAIMQHIIDCNGEFLV